jgi:hypothetical protein
LKLCPHCGGYPLRTALARSQGESETAVEGQLALESFPSHPTAIEARSLNGEIVQIGLDADGRFRVPLKPGTYSLAVLMDGARELIVFPRKDSTIDADFKVKSPNAVVSLGQVQHVASVADAGFQMLAAGTCSEGAMCIDDDTQVSCESEDDDDTEHEFDGEEERADESSAGAAGSVVEAAPTEGACAVAEHNAPNEIGCSGDDEGEGEGKGED